MFRLTFGKHSNIPSAILYDFSGVEKKRERVFLRVLLQSIVRAITRTTSINLTYGRLLVKRVQVECPPYSQLNINNGLER